MATYAPTEAELEGPLIEGCPKCSALPTEACVRRGRAVEPHRARWEVATLRYARGGWLPNAGDAVAVGQFPESVQRCRLVGFDERGQAIVTTASGRRATVEALAVLGPWDDEAGPRFPARPATLPDMAEQEKRGRGRPRLNEGHETKNLVVRISVGVHDVELDALVAEGKGDSHSDVIRRWLEASARRRAKRR